MESSNNLEKNLALMEDWYKTVIFDNDGKVLAAKNVSKPDEKELVYNIFKQ
jgi:hypothetical protein